jgi:hypothetical protein
MRRSASDSVQILTACRGRRLPGWVGFKAATRENAQERQKPRAVGRENARPEDAPSIK